MVFSSPIFLFGFLPITLICYFLLRDLRFKNIILLTASIIFYIFGEGELVLLMIGSIVANYFFGLWIEKKQSKKALFYGLFFNVVFLLVNKYANFFIEVLNDLLITFSLNPVKGIKIKLPIGISFYTFQSISYLVDVYRKENKAQTKITDLALYISLFPQLIAGPIIRYKDIAAELGNRKESVDRIYSGIKRFIQGLAKKVLLANTFALTADLIFEIPVEQQSAMVSWLGIICYSLQIYFDFSGYSDMAIGLGRIFGFKFIENFNFPYASKSIKEFWRRWHISLSNWFKDYLYIPLGGNQKGVKRTYINLLIVFLLTGFWHGAGWSFVFWGLFHGTFLVLERLFLAKLLERIWTPFQHIYLLLVVMIGWVFFRAEDFSYALDFTLNLFGGINEIGEVHNAASFINKELLFYGLIAVLGSSFIIDKLYFKIKTKINSPSISITHDSIILIGLFTVLILCILTTAMGTYSPFIYFRF
jgi:alginate O-acetyltransferase complex protein AlgI